MQEDSPDEAKALMADDAVAVAVAGSPEALPSPSCWTDPEAGKQPCV